MRIITILLLILVASCSKKDHLAITAPENILAAKSLASCNFGMNVFNKTKRPPSDISVAQLSSPKKQQPVVQNAAVILLAFHGDIVTHPLWNNGNTIECAPSNLHTSEVEKILQRVSEDFSPFNVVVTTDETVYNNAHAQKRIKIIVTETWEWFGMAGGIAYHDSFLWGNNTPAFVFSSLLHYNEKFIAEAISHELGHTFSLRHQSGYTSTCSLQSEYNSGNGNGATGWAPIMGNSYYKNVTTWHKGPTTGCGDIQDEVAILGGILGYNTDEDDKLNKSPLLVTTLEGMINHASDEDYFAVDISSPARLMATPHCIGDGVGANLHLKINVYGRNGKLISTSTNPASLTSTVQLEPGKYYIGIETVSNSYQTRYGMLGRYSLKVI